MENTLYPLIKRRLTILDSQKNHRRHEKLHGNHTSPQQSPRLCEMLDMKKNDFQNGIIPLKWVKAVFYQIKSNG